ncbi:MAG: YkgJ family cysteine cluster protein [Pseudomonadales bacterium]|nr:YkgJ family cysteine cluster protein [Pseudomonadales bacterium]
MKDCNQCGKCCIKYSDGALSASAQDIDDWELFNPEIYAYVNAGEIWYLPETKKLLQLCPWLTAIENTHPVKYGCDIYLDRPEDCRLYPSRIDEMQRDGCEMLEVKDLKNPKKAQEKLNKLMADSHHG